MKFLFSVVGIIVILIWGYKTYMLQMEKRELKKSMHVVEARILRLSCGRRDKIKLQIVDRIFNERIYLSKEECSELSVRKTIDVKIDAKGNLVFANDGYNNSSEMEMVATVLLCLFLISVMAYYGIISDIKKNEKYK